MIEQNDLTRARQLLDELDALWIILLLDLLFICKRLVLGWMVIELIAGRIQSHSVLLATEVLDDDIMFFKGEIPGPMSELWLHVDLLVCWLVVRWWNIVVEASGGGGNVC